MSQATTIEADPEIVSARVMRKVFIGFAVLAVLSLAISIAGRMLGPEIALGGYTDDVTPREVVIGNNVIVAPANMIRFERARRDGTAQRLDLYLRWPTLEGFTADARDDFNNVSGRHAILFLAFEERMMSRDMSGRFAPIYDFLIEKPGRPAVGDLTAYDFTAGSGYVNEELMVAERPGSDPYVARCLKEASAEESLAPCERDIQLGDGLSLTYRFPRELLAAWRDLDAAVTRKANAMVRTGR